jgi:hypothetical protein
MKPTWPTLARSARSMVLLSHDHASGSGVLIAFQRILSTA